MPSYDIRNAKTLGAALRHARSERGFTQEELAERLDITRNYLNEMETGKPNLWSTRIFRALRFLNVKVTISFETTRTIPTPKIASAAPPTATPTPTPTPRAFGDASIMRPRLKPLTTRTAPKVPNDE